MTSESFVRRRLVPIARVNILHVWILVCTGVALQATARQRLEGMWLKIDGAWLNDMSDVTCWYVIRNRWCVTQWHVWHDSLLCVTGGSELQATPCPDYVCACVCVDISASFWLPSVKIKVPGNVQGVAGDSVCVYETACARRRRTECSWRQCVCESVCVCVCVWIFVCVCVCVYTARIDYVVYRSRWPKA